MEPRAIDGSRGVRRILVVRGGAIGDLIVTEPSLRALRTAWPASRILLVGNAAAGPLLVASGIADAVTPLDADWLAPLFGEDEAAADSSLGRLEASLGGAIDLAVAWLRDPDSSLVGHLRRGAGRVIAGASVAPAGSTAHMVDHLASALEEAGIPVAVRVPRLAPRSPIHPDESESTASPSPPGPLPTRWRGGAEGGGESEAYRPETEAGRRRDRIAIHPGSGGRRKNWPAERFAEVAAALLAEGHEVIVLVGPADAEAASPLRKLGCPLVAPQDLTALAQVLTRCTGYLGNDSGVSHLAAALGVPAVAIFGPTDPRVWAPRGPHVEVLWAGPPALSMPPDQALGQVAVVHVLAAIRQCLT